jgi:uncharacterized protein
MPLPEGRSFTVNDQNFNFSVARSIRELLRGLGGISSLDDYDGMLFDFGYEVDVAMTPRGLNFPVEVAFISEAGEIKEITHLDPKLGFPSYSRDRVRFALETPVGFFDSHNIRVGDIITP